MDIKNALNNALNKLTESGVSEPASEVYYILSNVLGRDRSYIFAHMYDELDEDTLKVFNEFVERRSKHEPFGYIVNKKEFMGHVFHVTKDTLIPRPDTEILCEATMDIIYDKKDLKDNVTYLDMCTGTGCVGISVSYDTHVSVVMSDISPEALKVAKLNCEEILKDDYNLIESDLFENIYGKFDVISANPPYITEDEYLTLDSDVRDYEPKLALTADNDGLYFYERISAEAYDHLEDEGAILFEVGYDQSSKVAAILEKNGYKDIETYYDLSGIERVVKGIKK